MESFITTITFVYFVGLLEELVIQTTLMKVSCIP